MFVASFPLAHADRFSDWLDTWKKEQEQKAVQYQKQVLHFDYAKIQNRDAGFKSANYTYHPAKHIDNTVIYLKPVK